MELNTNACQSMLLLGKPGLSMLEDAISFAKKYLHTEKLELHPDFLLVKPANGKKTIGVEEASLIVSKGGLRPAMGEKQIVIIDGIDLMTVPAQNKLLKLLEDVESVLVIAIAYSSDVLETILSRLTLYEYKPHCLDAFLELYEKEFPTYTAHGPMFYYLTEGCIGLVRNLLGHSDMFVASVKAIEDGNLVNLLSAFHLLLENDDDAITKTSFVPNVICLLEACICAELEYISTGKNSLLLNASNKYSITQLLHMQDLIQHHKARCKYSSYSKDNFFHLIVELVAST